MSVSASDATVANDVESDVIRGDSPTRRAIRRLLHKRIAVVCLVVIAIFYGTGLFAPLIAPYGYSEQNLDLSFHSPTLSHPFGTDRNGRDVLSRTMYAARTTVTVTLATLLTGFIILPLTLGLLAGYRGGYVCRDEPRDRQRERALAGTGRSDDEHDLTGSQLEADPLQCGPFGVAVDDAQVVGVDRDGGQSGNPSRTPAFRSARCSATEPPATMTTAEIAMSTPRTTWTVSATSA